MRHSIIRASRKTLGVLLIVAVFSLFFYLVAIDIGIASAAALFAVAGALAAVLIFAIWLLGG